VRTGEHPGPSAVHYNRAGFGWNDEEAAASAARILRTPQSRFQDVTGPWSPGVTIRPDVPRAGPPLSADFH